MKTVFYRVECLTNLHVGAGDINYNIVDSEVEKDPITGYPIIHASGVKGGLRAAMGDSELVTEIVGRAATEGTIHPGTHKFFDAQLLARPMRVAGSASLASLPVVTVASLNAFLESLTVFGCNPYGITKVETPDFGSCDFLTNVDEKIEVEGEPTGRLDAATEELLRPLQAVIGERYAIVKNFDGYPLPVIARNNLADGRLSVMWYEEIVPHGSVFYFGVLAAENANVLEIPEIVQFGGHASVGCGYTRVTKL